MVHIQRMIAHILNPSENLILLSDSCMSDVDEMIQKALESKIGKIFTNTRRKKAQFLPDSPILSLLEEFKKNTCTFEEVSCRIAKRIFDKKMQAGQYENFDFIMAEGTYDGRHYIIGFENIYHEGITHTVQQQDMYSQNQIVAAKAMINSSLSKKEAAFTMEISDYEIYLIEEATAVEKEKRSLYETDILQCTSTLSYEQGVKVLAATCSELAEKYDLDEMTIVPKMKQIVKERVEQQEDIKLDEIANVLFDEKPQIHREFSDELQRRGFTQDISAEHMRPMKAQSVQKLKTDSGIEIIIPVDYMNSKDYVEFSNAADGTISIRLKNINKIISK